MEVTVTVYLELVEEAEEVVEGLKIQVLAQSMVATAFMEAVGVEVVLQVMYRLIIAVMEATAAMVSFCCISVRIYRYSILYII
jgi:hypothetical protein